MGLGLGPNLGLSLGLGMGPGQGYPCMLPFTDPRVGMFQHGLPTQAGEFADSGVYGLGGSKG